MIQSDNDDRLHMRTSISCQSNWQGEMEILLLYSFNQIHVFQDTTIFRFAVWYIKGQVEKSQHFAHYLKYQLSLKADKGDQ